MEILKSAVIQPLEMEKVAEMELPKDPSEWKKNIFNYFYETVPYLPKEAGVDIVISNIDDKKGYAKGSLVAFNGEKQINFPIVIKDFKLSPMDVFVMKVDNEYAYMNATEQNIRRAIAMDEMAHLKNYNQSLSSTDDIKSPGGIAPKNAVALDPYFNDTLMRETSTYGIAKRGMLEFADASDLRKLAADIKATSGLNYNFEQGVGDITKSIINLADDKEKQVPGTHVIAKIKPSEIIDAKQAITVLDSEIFDPANLPPIDAPAACELRVREFPCAEDFMSGGQSAITRMKETMSGKSVAGIVMPYKTSYSLTGNGKPYGQIFFSATGQFYCDRGYGYRREKEGGPLFCGAFLKDPKLMEKMVRNIAEANIGNLTQFKRDNSTDQSEKRFNPIPDSKPQNAGDRYCGVSCGTDSGDLYVIMGNGAIWEAVSFSGSFRKYMINNRSVYVSDENALVPTNVISIQKVSKIHDPIYMAALGKVKNIYLVPEMSFFLSTQYMKRIDENMVLGKFEATTKEDELRDKVTITKVACLINGDDVKFTIDGAPMESVNTLCGIEKSASLEPADASRALQLMGTTRERANEILKTAAVKNEVTVYGLRGDFVKADPFANIEKTARINDLFKQYASELRRDLVKEASMLSDPESVDVVLSLNFINDKNMKDYIDSISHMKKTLSKLCSLLVASRMGLMSVNEAATKSSVDGLQEVVDGLEALKLSVGK